MKLLPCLYAVVALPLVQLVASAPERYAGGAVQGLRVEARATVNVTLQCFNNQFRDPKSALDFRCINKFAEDDHKRTRTSCSQGMYILHRRVRTKCCNVHLQAADCMLESSFYSMYGTPNGKRCAAPRCQSGQWPGDLGELCVPCPDPLALKCSIKGVSTACRRGLLRNGICALVTCTGATYPSELGKLCLRCPDKWALTCNATGSSSCRTAAPCRMERLECCSDVRATSCVSKWEPLSCQIGYEVKNGICVAITCTLPNVMSRDGQCRHVARVTLCRNDITDHNTHLVRPGTGCCRDPYAAECSSRTNSTSCVTGYIAVNGVCITSNCTLPSILAQDGIGYCRDPYAASCSDRFASTSCVAGYMLVGKACQQMRCPPPGISADDNGGCCTDPHASACWNIGQPSACNPGWEYLGGGWCTEIYCQAPNPVLAENGAGCCSDALATSCSDPNTPTECVFGHKVINNACTAVVTCIEPNPVYSADGTGCCVNELATACSTPTFTTACKGWYIARTDGKCYKTHPY
ncbi:BZ3500_MvSof-1268-A1-R1_Chr1-1g01235 [Microbotryum saponariae]|uniref:BZ3500_MvSof-1268-A1-R1_Chr1-1g01235 protein n=1 Tax=Microbotryum saponariae TaxID=289078 RepID=A0A2X0ME75_9BASI|nr:BZ3500_MvSof-1268-A1-R1_Chr1-1g01235 [Microbotryum saponariae]SCZ93746.1 BZ3501_MvSof-1269-A2-R1_Chr1-1g00831 [Microbotryum saponariae]